MLDKPVSPTAFIFHIPYPPDLDSHPCLNDKIEKAISDVPHVLSVQRVGDERRYWVVAYKIDRRRKVYIKAIEEQLLNVRDTVSDAETQ